MALAPLRLVPGQRQLTGAMLGMCKDKEGLESKTSGLGLWKVSHPYCNAEGWRGSGSLVRGM